MLSRIARNALRTKRLPVFTTVRNYAFELNIEYPTSKHLTDIDHRRRKIVHECRKRGRVESELILGGFAKDRIWKMNNEQLDQFEVILKQTDYDLCNWLMGLKPAPKEVQNDVFRQIREYVESKRGKHYAKNDTFNDDYDGLSKQLHPPTSNVEH